jgi:hypothetical protein
MAVAEHLHFDMAGAAHQLFEIDLVLAEGGLRLAPRHRHRFRSCASSLHHPHAAAAAAPAGLEHHGIADLARQAPTLSMSVRQRRRRRHHRHAGG